MINVVNDDDDVVEDYDGIDEIDEDADIEPTNLGVTGGDDDEDEDDEDEDENEHDDDDDDEDDGDQHDGDDNGDSDSDEDDHNNGDNENDETGINFNSLIGGASETEQLSVNEDITGENNKKIVDHSDVIYLHPESKSHNYDEIHKASMVTRNENNIIVDVLHQSMPIMTKYEKAKIIGQRTKQLNEGETPFVTMAKPVIDNSIIAEEELNQKKLPFILQRPIPGGGFEYWNVKDLEIIRDD